MIRINLLPFRAVRTKENVRRQVVIFLLSFVLVTIALIGYNYYLNRKIGTLNSGVKVLKKELSRYQKKAREVDRIRKNLDVMKKKLNVIDSLERNRKEPLVLVDTFTEVLISQRMWLTALEKKNNSVNIKGIALDNKTVADFMTHLEKTPIFSSVTLKTLKHKKMKKSMNLKSFEITCRMSPLKSVKKAAKNKVK